MGCGTGENALFLASHGHGVVGVDSAPTAIRMAQEKAADRKLSVDFRVGDARELDRLGLAFDTAIDSGLFHTFSDEDRVEFASSLHGALAPGGTYFVMCFNEREPSDWDGPRRVSQKDSSSHLRPGMAYQLHPRSAFRSPSGRLDRPCLAGLDHTVLKRERAALLLLRTN